jgi:LmbE family N-acetylglucosaminyl deacetylase
MQLLNQELKLCSNDSITIKLNTNFCIPNGYSNALAIINVSPKALAFNCGIKVYVNDEFFNAQYIDPHYKGKRYINISNIPSDANIKLVPFGLRTDKNADIKVELFTNFLEYNEHTLLIAPHPDDIEIAAFALAKKLSNKYLVTISAGEKIKNLKEQYLPELDDDIFKSSKRKGFFRAFNAMSTPMIYGIKPENNIMLGYPDAKILAMSQNIHKQMPYANDVDNLLTPSYFRSFNYKTNLSAKLLSNPKANGQSLVTELVSLIDEIKPAYICITNPLLDSHPDHVGCSLLLGEALKRCKHKPQYIIGYVNHVKKNFTYPYGPVNTICDLPLKDLSNYNVNFKFTSLGLDNDTIKDKAITLQTMLDLQPIPRLEKHLKVKLRAKIFGDTVYHTNNYMITALKANECFLSLDSTQYIDICTQRSQSFITDPL